MRASRAMTEWTDRLGIERLCCFDMPPDDLVHLAADVGCRNIGISLKPLRYYNPYGYPDWSLREDAALRRAMSNAMINRGVRVSLWEGFSLSAGADPRACEADLDLVASLGAARINLVSMDRDWARTLDGFAIVANLAEARGIEIVTEIGVGPVKRLAQVAELADHVGGGMVRALIDTMHYFRLGGSIEELASAPDGLFGYIQLCDVPLVSHFEHYLDEALYERLPPGDGELPLIEFLRLAPPSTIIGIEVPQRSLVEAGIAPLARVQLCVEAARDLLMRAQTD